MFPPEIQRCMSELQPLQMKLAEAASSSQASVSQIYEWERQSDKIGRKMQRLTKEYGYPDAKLGEAAADAALGVSVLTALLRRAPEGQVSKTELLDRIEQLEVLYAKCEKYAARANSFNQQLTIDYRERLGQLAVFEQNIDKFMSRDTNPILQSERPATGGGCYIATAVYGSYDSPPVMTLRRYRDETLERSALGRAFIRSYYRVSPPLAKHLAFGSPLSRAARVLLDEVVRRLELRGPRP